ncbi:MAG: glycosyl hydrolase family 28-related protein [Deltaproteobacteria bacterium]|nr:glycosyl hydrolase family 28-related protein [Deltaproteobacteria bacterium]
MTISTTTNRYTYSGNGTTTAFAYSSKFLANGDIVVVLVDADEVETVQTITTHYTVTGAGDAGGGTVTMVTAPATGETLLIYQDPDITQAVDLVDGDELAVETQVEEPLDRLTLIAQRLDNRVDRTLRQPDGDVTDIDPMPTKAARASKYFVYDADGNPSASAGSGTDTSLRTDLAASGGSALSGFIQSGTGSVARTVQAKAREIVSVNDFGAVGDGVTDDTAAIAAAIATGQNVWFPKGVYGWSGGITLDTYGQKLIGAGVTDVTNEPTDGTVLKKLSGTSIGVTIATYTEGVEISGICFDQNSLGGSAIKTGMHNSNIHDIVIHNQGGTSYGIHCTGVNASFIERIRFSGTCYGGVLLDDADAIGYGALYSRFNKLFFAQTTGDLSQYGMKISDSNTLSIDDFYVQGGKGVYLNDGVSNINFRNLSGEFDDANELLVVDGATGTEIVGIFVRGGRASQVTTSAGTTAFFRLTNAIGVHIDGVKINDAVSAAARRYFLTNGLFAGSIKNITTNNTSGNAHVCVENVTNRSDWMEFDTLYNQGAGVVTLSLRTSQSIIRNSNMALSFNAASQLTLMENVDTVDLSNMGSGALTVACRAVSNGSGDAARVGYGGIKPLAATVASAADLDLSGNSATGNVFYISGTTGITSISTASTVSGRIVTLIFDGVLTVTDGSNLSLAGNFTTSAGDTLTLVCRSSTWYEIARSVN